MIIDTSQSTSRDLMNHAVAVNFVDKQIESQTGVCQTLNYLIYTNPLSIGHVGQFYSPLKF